MKLRRETIPAFLSIDVEPDALQISREQRDHWAGYRATYELVSSLRRQLAQASGAKPIFGWYFRTDPQIEEVCGRADFALTAFSDRTAALREEGDYFGVHPHAVRWSNELQLWVHDFRDRQWVRDSTQFALDAFAAWNGSPTKFFRSGAGFLSNEIVDVVDRNGVAVDLGLEPVAGWGLKAKMVRGAVDTSPIVGEYLNCVAAPRTPYHPSHDDFRKPGNGDARRILMIPLSTGYAVLPPRGLIPRLKRRLRGESGPDPGQVRMLYPSEDDWTERGFWDLVSQQLRSMERPYVSLAIRTDRFESARGSRVSRVFSALMRHPLARRLRFVDPLSVTERITPQPAFQGHTAGSMSMKVSSMSPAG
jgi:hypothetical protein